MIRRAIGLVFVLVATSAAAQPVPGDGLVAPWPDHRHAADVASTITAGASIALDTWASWRAPDRSHAFLKQAERDGAILISAEIVKRLVSRTRPDGSDRFSFFSEHTAFAASALGGPRLVITLPLMVDTGYLRNAAGKHYVTDTLVGAIVGALFGHFLR